MEKGILLDVKSLCQRHKLCFRDMMASKEAQEKTKRMGEALGLVPPTNKR